MLSFPWVIDGITANESAAISAVFSLMNEYPELGKEVLGLWWVPDDMPTVEAYALLGIRDLARNNLALAWQAIGELFMEPPFRYRDEYALQVLVYLSWDWPESKELLAQISSQPWFNDGLDDLEAALLHAIVVSNQDFRQGLIETHYVASAPITLPLAGDVELIVVRHTPLPPDDHTFETLEEGVRAIEGFMGAPFPVDDVILVVPEPDIWSVSRHFSSLLGGAEPAHLTAALAVNDGGRGPLKSAIYHELAHYYHLHGPRWLVEGAANFLEAYVLALTGVERLEERLAHLESHSGCFEGNIQQHVEDWKNFRPSQCDYDLGERFLLAMHMALGPEAVSAALKDLYTQSLLLVFQSEDVIYHAFQSNVPPESEEAFKNAYRQYHGGPFADTAPSDSPDRLPLVALYETTKGEEWLNNANWLNDAPVGTWHGVITEPGGRVGRLDLSANQLTGQLPPELGSLSNLTNLFLARNSLVGEIPPELGSLSELRWLSLGGNQLTGEIPPELGNLAKLWVLGLWENRLSGEIPAELGRLSSLLQLQLGSNQLTGQIPSELGNLTDLTQLQLQRNQLSGTVPAELGILSSLEWLDLGNNQLVGGIPAALGNLQNLENLRLSDNRLTGRIPSELGNLTTLSELNLSNNMLSGKIPPEVGSLSNLRDLYLQGNLLSGEIPSEIGNLSNLKWLNLSHNRLTGEIPPALGNLSNLEELLLGGNRFTGCIPPALRDIPINDLESLGLPYC